MQPGAANLDLARGDGQTEAARARTAGIHEERSVPCLDEWLVGMAGDDEARIGGRRPPDEIGPVVQDMYADSGQPHRAPFGES